MLVSKLKIFFGLLLLFFHVQHDLSRVRFYTGSDEISYSTLRISNLLYRVVLCNYGIHLIDGYIDSEATTHLKNQHRYFFYESIRMV